jgi:hypothetical protein
MAGKADDYRRFARECLAIAQSSSTHARLTLVEMTRVWMRLADEQDAAFVQPKKDDGMEGQ